jgi:murein DD-endopeptidase MepM/ murein hydrolase activator NlpD
MRWVALLILDLALLTAPPSAAADDGRLSWPMRPAPAVVRTFDAPSPNWLAGHRGVDLAGLPGQPVYAPANATIVFAGVLAGRPVVSLAHPGGLHTSYEPVRASVRAGQEVTVGAVIGQLMAGHGGCPVQACLHWGAMWGPAARAEYVDPLGLLKATPVRLKPRYRARRADTKVPFRPPKLGLLRLFAVESYARGWAWSCTARNRETATCVYS